MILAAIVLSGILICTVLTRRYEASARDIARLEELEQALASRYLPVALGTMNALLVWWWVGWHLNPPPMIQDEAAYLLQAELFARGRWTSPSPPFPEFFTQMHVLTEPVLASKYPLGFSLLLTPFVAIGAAVLGPMVFAGLSGALIYILARRAANGYVAVLTWILWTSGSALLRYQAAFLSQTVTVLLWLMILYFLLRYRHDRQTWALPALAVSIAFMAITRPVTAVAIALPASCIVIPEIWRRRAWRPVVLSALVGTSIVALLPVQNRMTTGDWRLSPLVMYSRAYTPFDFPGFGYTERPVAPLPPDLDSVRTYLTEARRQHTLDALPATLRTRVWHSALDLFAGWRAPLLLFAIIGVFSLSTAAYVAVGASVVLFLAYAFHAHWPYWTAYYVEGYPAVLFASSIGITTAIRWVHTARMPTVSTRVAALAIAIFLLIPSTLVLPRYRAAWQRTTTYQRRFLTALSIVQRETSRSLVFVDYGRNHDVHSSLVWNVADYASASTWIAHDRGVDGLRLMRLAPDRQAYVFHADEGRLVRLPPVKDLQAQLAGTVRTP